MTMPEGRGVVPRAAHDKLGSAKPSKTSASINRFMKLGIINRE